MPSFVISSQEAGQRLDVVLAARAGLSRARAQRLLKEGQARVDGATVRKHDLARAGARVDYTVVAQGTGVGLEPEDLDVEILYEDDALLVVDKPAGMVVHPAVGHERGTLVHALVAHGVAGGHERRPGVVHRLDKDTSGLLVLARGDAAYTALVAMIADRRVHREYQALVHGRLAQEQGVIDAPIGRHVRERTRMSVHTAAGRRAVTHFSITERLAQYTLLAVQLETGRTHQIRVHFSALGHPIAGDVVYGRRPRPPGLARQFLHAWRLEFDHPLQSDHRLRFESPLPADLAAFLAQLRKPSER